MAERRRERKVVTVLFADLVGFTAQAEQLDPEDVEAILGPYHERLRAELERFGGTVEKFIGDAVMALFGAPVAHEDDPERAVRAALAIRDWARDEDSVQVRIAVNTGEALINLGARPEAGEGMATGDVVNTTARLQSGAPTNGVLVGATTYRATRNVIDYRDAEPVDAKGKAEPIEVWEALEPRSRVGTEAVSTRVALVGRERELNLLRETLVRVREESSPQLVTLVGVPGIGKSRLVRELMQAVEESGVLTYWRQGRSLPYGDGVSFWALSEMVKAQAGILETDDEGQVATKLKTAVTNLVDESEGEWLDAQLRPLAGLASGEDLAATSQTEAFAAWRRFFEAMAEERPLVLVFEDVHWADDGMLDFVDHLVDWAGRVPLLIVCTARPELLERRPGWGGGKLNATTLSLSPLSEEETARLFGALLDRPLLEADQQEALLARAGGNPLYAEQFAHMLAEQGETGELPLPESVQGIIAARLDRLAADEKSLLQDASVHGKVFWAGSLADGRSDETARLLHALERKGFVQRARRSSVGDETEYAFLHLLVRDVAYGQIPRADRAAKHLAAARWIESLGRREDHAELLAHHYRNALELMRVGGAEIPADLIDRSRAADVDAGDRALALNAHAAAAQFFQHALELAGQVARDERARLEYGLARALFGMGDDRRVEVLERTRELLLEVGERDRAAEADGLLAEAWFMQGQLDRCLACLDRAGTLISDAPPTPEKARVLGQICRFQMLGDENEKALQTAVEALALSERFSLDELRINVLVTVGTAKANSGDLEGIAELEQAAELAEGRASPAAWRAYNNLAVVVWIHVGDFLRCRQLHEQGLRAAQRAGDPTQILWFKGQFVYDAYWSGDFDEALRNADTVIAEAESGSPHAEESGSRAYRARIRLARGDEAGALADAERAIALCRTMPPGHARAGRANAAFVLLAAGRKREAAMLADEALSRVRVPDPGALVPLCEILVDLDRADEFSECLTDAIPTPWMVACKAYAAGNFEDAADLFAGMSVPDEAYSRLRAAAAYVALGRRAEADEQLQKALAFYRSVGATRYIREGEALLAASA